MSATPLHDRTRRPPPLVVRFGRRQAALELTTAEHVVAMTMTLYARPDGTGIRPGIARLARETALSERTVYRALEKLATLGLIAVTRAGGGRGLATEYRLNPDTESPFRQAETLTPRAINPDTDPPETLTGSHPNRGSEQGGTGSAPRPTNGWSAKQRAVLRDMDAEHRERGDGGWLERELQATANASDQYRAIADHHGAWRNAGQPRPAVRVPSSEEQLAAWQRDPRWLDGTLNEHELIPELQSAYRDHRHRLELAAAGGTT